MEKSIGSSNEAQISSILGIDYGKSKIGLAIADTETKMAFAFDTLKNDKDLLSNLKEIVKNRNIETIVMGIAWHEKDAESSEEKEIFANLIKKELNLPVVFQDEMFTTKMAQENIKQHGGRDIARADDKEAARIILQSWLDSKQRN